MILVSGILIVNCAKSDSFNQISTSAGNIAIKGYDTVAYFADKGAVKGDPKFEFVWNGAKWFFANSENLEKFKANPEQFAPQFGGHCSFSISKGNMAEGDPEAWKMVDGKLYLNNNQEAKKMWEAEQEKRIQDGEKNWEELKSKK